MSRGSVRLLADERRMHLSSYKWHCDHCGGESDPVFSDHAAARQAHGLHLSQCRPQTGVRPAPLPYAEGTAIVTPWLAKMSDEQLRAECERRGIVSGDLLVIPWAQATDQHVLAEASRRGLRGKLDADINMIPMQDVARREEALTSDRDEWKRRAEAAEEDLKIALRNNRELGLTLAAGVQRIDPRPDNSIAHLDEDLLCEDA